MKNKNITNDIRERLHAIDPSAEAFVFGSQARGDARPDSDWDILILLDKPRITLEDYNKYSYPLWEQGWDYNALINTTLFTKKEWSENRPTLFNHNVRAEAIAL